MFFTLGGMLVFSSGLILYASLFTGPEAKFLLTTPARADQIFATKFQAAVVFSGWAFLVLGGPILVAYGLVFDVPWPFYAVLPAFFVGFLVLAGAVGSLACLALVNAFPQRRKQALVGVAVLLVALAAWWVYRFVVAAKTATGDREALQGLFDLFALARNPMSPSRWVARGLMNLARGDPASAVLPLVLLWSNALFAYLLAAWGAEHLYRRGFNRMATGGDMRRKYGSVWLDRVMEGMVFFLPRPTRVLVVKDFRTFRRDPPQVGQLVIFCGLLLLCVLNSRQFFGADIPTAYRHGLSVLNLSVSGLLLCVFLCRFVYPLISLEGRKFWILGLLPLDRRRILWGKFAFALTGGLVVAGGVVSLSDLLLDMPTEALCLHLLTVVYLAVGLSGLCVGLSAWMPNFRETDPSKIVAGFGGTMNMIACLAYLLIVIAVVSGPYHAAAAFGAVKAEEGMPWWGYAGTAGGLVLTSLACFVPMRLGERNLKAMEF